MLGQTCITKKQYMLYHGSFLNYLVFSYQIHLTSNRAHLVFKCSTSSFNALFSFSSSLTFFSACILTERTIPVDYEGSEHM